MRSILTLFLFGAAACSLSAEAPPLDGTMPEDYVPGLRSLIKTAVESSPTTIIANINVVQAQANSYQQSSSLYPQLSANTFYQIQTQAETNTPSTTQKGLYYTVAISQPVFQWGAFKNQAGVGHLGVLIAERNFDEAYRMLVVNIREQFTTLTQLKVALRNSEFNLKIDKQNMTAQQARFDAGSSSQAELSNFQLVVEQAQLDTDRAHEDYRYHKQILARLVGIPSLDENAIPLELPHPEFTASKADAILAGFEGGGAESAFQAQVYQLYAKQAELDYKIAKVRLLPKLGVNASFSYEDYSEPVADKVSQTGIQTEAVNIMATWTIFDGFATIGAKKSALALKRTYERNRQTYEENAIDQIANMRQALGFSARSMVLTEVHTALMDAQVKRLTQDQTLGYASQATIDQSLVGLYISELSQTLSRADYYNRWSAFVSLAGVDPALANLPAHYAR